MARSIAHTPDRLRHRCLWHMGLHWALHALVWCLPTYGDGLRAKLRTHMIGAVSLTQNDGLRVIEHQAHTVWSIAQASWELGFCYTYCCSRCRHAAVQ